LDDSVTPEWFPEADVTSLGWWVQRERWRVPMRVRVVEENLNEAEDGVEKKEARRRKVVEAWVDSGWWDEDEAEVCLNFFPFFQLISQVTNSSIGSPTLNRTRITQAKHPKLHGLLHCSASPSHILLFLLNSTPRPHRAISTTALSLRHRHDAPHRSTSTV
jgi:hypothetical protein